MAAHTFFKSKSLVNAGEHVGVVALCFVVGNKTALPQRADGFDALELVGLFALVAGDGELEATQFPLAAELVEDGVLHEICFHVPAHGNSLSAGPLVEVITPADHFGHGALPDKCAEVPELRAGLAPEFRSLKVVFG